MREAFDKWLLIITSVLDVTAVCFFVSYLVWRNLLEMAAYAFLWLMFRAGMKAMETVGETWDMLGWEDFKKNKENGEGNG